MAGYDMEQLDHIFNLIPHRPPFLWVDRILTNSATTIVTEKEIDLNLPLFQGHFPGKPIVPGVILCEAIFQSGALLMALNNQSKNEIHGNYPVLTRITAAKFKKPVTPGDTVRMEVTLIETLSSASIFHGVMRVSGKVVLSIDFICTMANISH
jgi:3-hydroxyacyl-[acyl-carrier-protein] dehydratase